MTSAELPPVPVFQVFESSVASTEPPVLGVWETTEMSSGPLSFGTNDQQTTCTQIFRVNLPANVNQAHAQLDAGATQLDLAQQMLESVPERLEQVAAGRHGQSFDLVGSPGTAQPEIELMDFLREIEAGATPVSFGIEFAVTGADGRRALQRLLDFFGQLRNSLDKYAWVETLMGARIIARTAVGWTGDVNTAWIAGLTLQERAVHTRTLSLALRTRDALARTVIIVVQAAVKISVLLSTPVTAPFALLAAYRYVQALIGQLESMPSQNDQEDSYAK